MLEITQADFLRLVRFMKANYGIELIEKKHLVQSRLANYITGKGFTGFEQYVNYILKEQNPEEITVLINRLTTNHTYFMRETDHFDFFRDQILPQLEKSKKNRSLGIWSAGCSSGEEPYTLSMILRDYFGGKRPPWDTRILATDISQKVLQTAKAGVYPADSVVSLPEHWLRKYFVRKGDDYEVSQQLRDNVIFREFNLMDPIHFKSRFDVIFCRNVMIYFDMETKNALVHRFYDAMNPGGYLLIGHSESFGRETVPFRYIMPAVYQK